MSDSLTPQTTIIEFEGKPLLPTMSTENQRKIIKDKYLRGDDTVDSWLLRVANNVALAELLHHPSHHRWGLFDGVRVFKKEAPSPENSKTPPCRSWLFHLGLTSSNERDTNIQRFLQNSNKISHSDPEARECIEKWTNAFYELLSSWKFLPNSPTLMNAGNSIQQLAGCYVLPVEDSMEGITKALQAQAQVHKSGGGTGFSFEKIRPAGATVNSTHGVASGVVNFIQVFDKMTSAVKQGGNRRGANMGILPYWHPEIKSFIHLKSRPGIMENFNLSISMDGKFMKAVENDEEIDLINPQTQEPVDQIKARELFDLIVENAWKTGDPGIIFTDIINNSTSNPTPALGQILATNPCGEQPLLPNEPCHLGSINLSKFVCGKAFKGDIDWEKLKETITIAVRFLDNIIEVNNYPFFEMEQIAKSNRRIGLGIMGWSEMLVKLGLSYDSHKAVALAEDLMQFINSQAMGASEELAQERGAFPNWKNSIYDASGPYTRGNNRYPRHAARTTIAPTGTISMAAGLQGAGIEPFFAMAYTRYSGKALDMIKKGLAPEPEDIYFEVNPLFKKLAERHNYFGVDESALWEKIEKNGKSVRGIPEIPEWIQTLFATAQDISVDWHLRIQAAFQKHTDNAVSKTVNLPQDASLKDVEKVFREAFKYGCKGITVYRSGSRQQQVLSISTEEEKTNTKKDFSQGVSSEYYEVKTGHGPLHVHIDFGEEGPFRVFASMSPLGTEVSGLASATGILLSKYLEEGGNPNLILSQLKAIKGDRPVGQGVNKINSVPHGISWALSQHLKKHGWYDASLDSDDDATAKTKKKKAAKDDALNLELWNLTKSKNQCPHCFSTNTNFNSGCSGLLCLDCGFSECQS